MWFRHEDWCITPQISQFNDMWAECYKHLLFDTRSFIVLSYKKGIKVFIQERHMIKTGRHMIS